MMAEIIIKYSLHPQNTATEDIYKNSRIIATRRGSSRETTGDASSNEDFIT